MSTIDQPTSQNEERVKVDVSIRVGSNLDYIYTFSCPECEHKIEFHSSSIPPDYQLCCGGCGVNMTIDRKSLDLSDKEMYESVEVARLIGSIVISW